MLQQRQRIIQTIFYGAAAATAAAAAGEHAYNRNARRYGLRPVNNSIASVVTEL